MGSIEDSINNLLCTYILQSVDNVIIVIGLLVIFIIIHKIFSSFPDQDLLDWNVTNANITYNILQQFHPFFEEWWPGISDLSTQKPDAVESHY